MVIFSFIILFFLVLFSDVKAYFPSRKPWAALGAAATIRKLERVYNETRTYFKERYANSTIEPTDTGSCDRSGDIAAAGRPAPTVLPRTMTNDEGLKSKADLNSNSVVIYQAKPPNPGYFGSPDRQGRPGGIRIIG